MSKEEKFEDCLLIYEKFSRCLTISAQLENIHRYSEVKDCTGLFRDWRLCLYSKLITDPQKAKEVYLSSNAYAKSKHYKEVNDIFEYKDKPSWD